MNDLPILVGYSPNGFLYFHKRGRVFSVQVTTSPAMLDELFCNVPKYSHMKELLDSNPHLS